MSEVFGNRILRVTEGYETGRNTSQYQERERILKLFRSRGFQVVEGGIFDPMNPLELAMLNRDRKQDLKAANAAGFSMPATYDPKEVLSSQTAVVAKIPEVEGGLLKYLLESTDQKVKFIAWCLLDQSLSRLVNNPNPRGDIERVLEKVKRGIFVDDLIKNQGWLGDWVFEEFIETPGDYFTSFRIIADAFGKIHYGQVTRSENKKGSLMKNPILRYSEDPIKEVSVSGANSCMLLEHPKSSLYIAPKRFVSNLAQGGARVLLNGEAVIGDDRKLLADLGINPDDPKIPDPLLAASQIIGAAFRPFDLYVGIDFIKRKNSEEFVLLEVNKKPGIKPSILGLPNDAREEDCEVEMARRVIMEIG